MYVCTVHSIPMSLCMCRHTVDVQIDWNLLFLRLRVFFFLFFLYAFLMSNSHLWLDSIASIVERREREAVQSCRECKTCIQGNYLVDINYTGWMKRNNNLASWSVEFSIYTSCWVLSFYYVSVIRGDFYILLSLQSAWLRQSKTILEISHYIIDETLRPQ